MTELILLTIILTAILRTIRKLRPGALPGLANLGLRTPLRNRFFGPARVLLEAGIQPGWCVLELGPGWGFLTHEAAREVGPEGQLVGLDMCPKMLEKCQEKVHDPAHALHLVCGNGEMLPFTDAAFDAALLVSVLGEVQDRPAMFREMLRCLKPGAALIVNELVLDPDYVFPWTVRKMGADAGFEIGETTGNILSHTTRLVRPQVELGIPAASTDELVQAAASAGEGRL
ncbi:MAG: class I SAM-dependent methyltransferase [Armatimonadetes bacterium]|nr:class I SAM-dependent methyltransferase [Armatimonadota bacterium]